MIQTNYVPDRSAIKTVVKKEEGIIKSPVPEYKLGDDFQEWLNRLIESKKSTMMMIVLN